jgi:hypothetical protein
MSQSAKANASQEVLASARRGRMAAAGDDALRHAAAALARAGFSDSNLVLRWADIVGADIARIARPVKLQEGPTGAVLTVACDPGAIVFLQHETRGLIERLNRYLGIGRITRLKLVPGSAERIFEPPPHPYRGGRSSAPSLNDTSPKQGLFEALERLGQSREKARIPRPSVHSD